MNAKHVIWMQKARALVDEILPYLQKFKGKFVVIKYGGNAMINNELKISVIKDITFLHSVGIKPILVHGGGPEITKEMEKFGVKPVFINGLRATDAPTIKIIKTVFVNINKEIQDNLKKLHVQSIGIHNCMLVEQKSKELGFVGEVKKVNTEKIMNVVKQNKIPVISPLGSDIKNQIYNINADTAAVKIAVALKAVKLTMLTNVDGVMENNKLISHLSIANARKHMQNGVITRSMIPKVEACIEAVESGCAKAHIINGMIPHSLLFEIFTEKGVGTEIVK